MATDDLIFWDKAEFELGIAFIDTQHKTLVDYINELARAIDNDQAKTVISTLFEKLYDYTKFHFKAEEAYFFKLNKDDCLLHQLQHKHFIEELDRIIVLDDAENISKTLLYFLTDWLINHIQGEDKKFLQQQKTH